MLGRDELWLPVMVGLIASLVSMIPLGLVLLTSIAFAVGAVKLARHNVLVQELAAVEGLARADIVCFDKTGTLTEGQIVFDQTIPVSRRSPAIWRTVLGMFAARSDASATTKALLEAFPDAPAQAPSSTVPFSSSRQWSAAAVERGRLKGSWMLGAPERLLDLDDARYARVARLVNEMTHKGRRTLLLAHAPDPAARPGKDPYEPIVIVVLTETIRHDVAQTLAYFAEQGVGLRVFSGDNPQTVAAIAREAGIDVSGGGYDARKLPKRSADLTQVLEDTVVFGRVTPDQKKAMVRALQKTGHVVAMIGDGVNDTMAVKQADIGVAMGSGSEATRAVARLILLESDFTQFPRVIAEGRQVMANIERLALIFLSKTAYIMTISIIFGLTLWGFPFLPRQLSAVDGLTIGLPAFFLALMPSTSRYLPGFIGRTLRRAVPLGLTTGAVITGLALYLRMAGLYSPHVVQSSLVLALALLALWILVIFARPLNRWRLAIIAVMYIGLAGTVGIPIIRDFFELTIPPRGALIAVGTAAAIGCVLYELLVRSRGRWAAVMTNALRS
jgi:cation-transporting ATPase E